MRPYIIDFSRSLRSSRPPERMCGTKPQYFIIFFHCNKTTVGFLELSNFGGLENNTSCKQVEAKNPGTNPFQKQLSMRSSISNSTIPKRVARRDQIVRMIRGSVPFP
jgi:hypothetical protein